MSDEQLERIRELEAEVERVTGYWDTVTKRNDALTRENAELKKAIEIAVQVLSDRIERGEVSLEQVKE